MTKKEKIRVGIIIGAVVLASAILVAASFIVNSARISELTRQNELLSDGGETLEGRLASLENAKSALEEERDALIKKLSDADARYTEDVAALEAEIAARSSEIEALEADIAKYRTVFDIDVRAQARLINEIVEYIETKCPYVKVGAVPSETEDGEETEGEWVLLSTLIAEERQKAASEGELFTEEELTMSGLTRAELTEKRLFERVLAREDVTYPNVSIYYEDLATGYHFDYNSDKAYLSASVVKAPYIMSVMEAIAKDEERYLDSLAAKNELPEQIDTDGDGTPDKIKIEYSNPAYDLSEVVVYDKATMFKSGSGTIQNMPDGTEFTYLDFMRHTLESSDNIAYAQLRSRFGYSTMTALASRVGANIAYSTMTAKGAGRLFKAIYEFIEDNDTYGAVLRDSLAKSNHSVIIPAGVSPTRALHKYGWDTDSYHDAAIVLYGDHPYVLAVFSDLDKGGNEINAYLREIVRMINKLHAGFYEDK